MKKRVFALLLCLLLCFSILPVGAFADDYCEHDIVKMDAKATCGEAHREHYKCTKCGKLFSDERGEHEISYESVAQEKLPHTSELKHVEFKDASCTESGNYEYWLCEECGQMFSENPGFEGETDNRRTRPVPDDKVKDYTIEPYGHNLTFHDAVPHTCTENGTVAYYQCTSCGLCFSDPDAQNLLPDITDYAPGHVKTEHEAVDHTCDTNGNTYYFYCEVCGKYYNEYEEEIAEGSWLDPARHDYEEHPFQEPTCTAGGNRLYYICSGCGSVLDADGNDTTLEAVTLGKIPHSLDIHVPAVAKSCYTNGNVEYWQCTSCGAKYADAEGTLPLTDEEVVIPACHEFVATPAKEPTCTEPGNIAYWTCTAENCGIVVDESGNQVWETVVPAKGHAFQLHEAREASCTEDGNEAYYSCDTCGKLFRLDGVTETTLEEVTIPQLGHKLGDLVPAVEPTCTTDGHIAYYECEQCHEKFADAEEETVLTEDEIVIPKSHDLEAHSAKAATCTEPGNTAYSTCKNCDIVLNENGDQIWLNDTVIPAPGHKPEKVEATASCTEAGYAEHYKCSTCGKLFKDAACTAETTLEELTVQALGHDYDADGWCTRCKALSPDSPEFAAESYVSAPTPQGWQQVIIRVSAPKGVFPAGAQLSAQVVPVVDEKTKEAVDAAREERINVAQTYTFDVKILDRYGFEVQPADGSKVNISFSLAEVKNDNLDATVYHVKETEDGSKSAEALETSVEGEAVVAETEGFSYYTVEFTYRELVYVLPGEESVPLDTVLSTLNLSGTVQGVTVSNSSLFNVLKEGDAWIVYSYQPFQSEEWMKIILDGFEYTIKVTDSGEYTVSFITAHGTAPSAQIIEAGKTATIPEDLSWIGYKWSGWCTDIEGKNSFDFKTPITSNTILYAKWIPDLKITKGDGGTAHYGSTYAFTMNYYYPDYNQNSSTFAVCIGQNNSTTPSKISNSNYVVTQGTDKRVVVTLKASFIRTLTEGATYTVLFDTGLDNDLGSTEGAFKVSKSPKTDKTVPVVENESGKTANGYALALDLNFDTYKDSVQVFVDNVLLTTPEQYIVTQGSTVTTLTESFLNTLTDGEHLMQVSTSAGSANRPFVTAAGKAVDEYTITMENGVATVDGIAVSKAAAGLKVTISTAIPSGREFYQWESSDITIPDAEKVKETTTFTMPAKNVSIKATTKWNVSFEMNGIGTVSPNPQPVAPNGHAKEPTTPVAEGYVFGHWYTDNGTFKNEFDFNKTAITQDITLYAKWQCEVVFFTEHGTAPAKQIVDIDAKATKPADLSWIGYKWGGWYTDPAWTNAFDFKTPITRNTVLFAKWIPDLKITKGDGGTAHYGSTYAFTLNYYYPDYNKNSEIFKVFIARSGSKDLAVLGKNHYVVTQGADKRAVVTLKASYIRTLADGLTYDIVFDTGLPHPPEDLGYTSGSFRVSKAPKTGDESNVALWAAIAGVSLIAVVVIVAVLLNKRKKGKKAPTPPETRSADKTRKPPKE